MLTSILKEGAQFSSLAETALADRLSQMLDLVTAETADGDVPLVMALIDSVPPENIVSMAPLPNCEYLLGIHMCCVNDSSLATFQDELAEVLVILFDSKHRLAPFLTSILSTEVRMYCVMAPPIHLGAWSMAMAAFSMEIAHTHDV